MTAVATRSTLNYRTLLNKPRHDLAHMVLDFATEVERLQKELMLERNTNVHLKAAINSIPG